MHDLIRRRAGEVAEACRRFGVVRLMVFGSAARAVDIDEGRSDVDLLVSFAPWTGDDPYPALEEALEGIFWRRVDLLDARALATSRNYLRKAAIMREAETVFEA